MSTEALKNVSLAETINLTIFIDPETKIDKTANKINYWALFGLIFLTLGAIATTTAICGYHMIFHASLATLDNIAGSGVITFTAGALSFTKAIVDKYKINNDVKKFKITGIKNKNFTCWLNSLMQMLLNVADLKKTLKKHPQFKKFIDDYKKAIKNNTKINTLKLKEFLKTICPEILNKNESFHDVHEILKAILDLFKDSNPNLKNHLIIKHHFRFEDGSIVIEEKKTEDTGILELPPSRDKQKKDSLQTRLAERFLSKQDNEANVINVVKKPPGFFGLIKRQREVFQEVVVGKKINTLEEIQFSFPPNDFFFAIQRYETDNETNISNKLNYSVKVPLQLKIMGNHFENNLDANYQLNNFICHLGNHYIAYIKKGKFWFKCDDDRVKKISLNKALKASKKAYIVHYKKLR